MKIFSLRIRSLLLACAAFCINTHAQEGAGPPRLFVPGQRMVPALNFEGDIALNMALPIGYPRPESDWKNNEKAFYTKLLSQGKFDTLFVPFQVSGWSFDRPTRSLMTATLSLAAAQTGTVKTPDPYLVAKALGEGQRQFKQEDIFKLANAMGVQRIIWGYAGHDRQEKMRIRLVSQERPQNAESLAIWRAPSDEKKFEAVAFTDEVPPIEAYVSLLPHMLKALKLEAQQPLFNSVASKLDWTELPDSPKGLSASSDNPARDAYAFLLYRGLVSENDEWLKARFAEKAFLAQLRLSPVSPEYKALRARTYMALGQRLAGIKVIGTPQNDEERQVLAALNGDFTSLRTMAAREKNPLKRLIEQLDEYEVGYAYGLVKNKDAVDRVRALKLPGTVWPFIASRAFTDRDLWSQFDNAQLKMLLDYELPVKGYSLDAIAKGALSIGDPAKLQTLVDLSVFHHGRKYLEQNASQWCCQAAFNRPQALDYLELLQSFGSDNLIRSIRFQSELQGRPESAIALANNIDPVYKGHPHYTVSRAFAEYRRAEQVGGVEKESLMKSAYQNAFNASYWEQGQSLVADFSRRTAEATGRNDYGWGSNFYYTDIPFRPLAWPWSGGDPQTDTVNQVAALKNATYEISALRNLVAHYHRSFPNEPKARELLKSMEGRFIGAPDRNRLFAEEALLEGNAKSAEAFYRDNLKRMPEVWNGYDDLGRMLLKRGDVSAAAKVYLSFPGFKPGADESRIVIANCAADTGVLFYWTGHPELAKPFFSIAANQRTGAAAELVSASRLKLMAGDIPGAMDYALRTAQRYQDNRRYQDYLGMLHAMGQTQDAWAGFNSLVEAGQGPEIVESALVGHHIEGHSEAEIIDWVKASGLHEEGTYANAAISFLLEFVTTDRTPSDKAVAAIQSLGLERVVSEGDPGQVLVRDSQNPLEPNERLVKSSLALFAQGYRALKTQDFAVAKSVFEEAASYDQLTYAHAVSPDGFFLPYYAMAAAKTHATKEIEALLAVPQAEDGRGFYYYLAQAVLAGSAGDSERALQFLNTARYLLPDTENWPLLKAHSFAEVAEWVSEMTSSPKIKALALDWAKRFQMVQPWHAWSYALEAKLTQNPMDRKRALAMAYYLDSKSERLARFKQSEIDEAVKVFGKSNPFLKKPHQGADMGDV